MTEFTVNILIIGIPGIIAFFLSQKLYGKRERGNIEVILLIFLYSILSYASVGTIEAFIAFRQDLGFVSDTFNIILGKNQGVTLGLLLKGVLAGIAIAYIASYIITYNIINRVGQHITATKRYGDEDVWHYFHNSPDSQKNHGWVFVRDLKEQLTYYCYISTWSDSNEERELILSDVSVFSNITGDYLYSANHIYLGRKKDNLMIEVPIIKNEKEKGLKFKENGKEKTI